MIEWTFELRHALEDELAPGERIEWRGRPNPSVGAASEWSAIAFGAVWLAFTGHGLRSAINDGNAAMAIALSAFVLVGLFIVTRPLAAWDDQRRTAFAITDRRLIVLQKGGRSVTSILRCGIRQVERVRKGRGVTLRIPTQTVSDGDGGRVVHHITMYGPEDREAAYRLLTRSGDQSALAVSMR